MLILRQVLMGESSKATAQELDNATAELFKALVKMLDASPDAGAEEIVEAMMSASAAVGSPSEEKIQGRRQTTARVLLKSLQPSDVVPCRLLRLPWSSLAAAATEIFYF